MAAGTNLSGVLKRPELSIPRGELTALAHCIFTYGCVVVCFGASVSRDTLKSKECVRPPPLERPTGRPATAVPVCAHHQWGGRAWSERRLCPRGRYEAPKDVAGMSGGP